VLRTEVENSFEDFMLFEMKSVTFIAPYNFDTYKADVVVPMQLVELQCDSLLREKFSICNKENNQLDATIGSLLKFQS
jgi:hypothetical protein